MIVTTLMDLPTTIKAFSTLNEDGSHTIVINARLSEYERAKSYEHELSHIANSDFDSEISANEIETLRHKTGGPHL